MIRTFATFLFACALPMAVAQDIPGVRTTLVAESQVVVGADVKLRLTLDIAQEVELPADLLRGVLLDVTVGDQPGESIRDHAEGESVKLPAGTTFSRVIKVPVARVAPSARGSLGMVPAAFSWPGIPGANCVVRIAPDVSGLTVDQLDLDQTKVLLITNFGEMAVAFYPQKAPKTVENFLKLSMQQFYDGTKFHRVIRDFMIQGGDPYTKDDAMQARWGQGDPGYKIKAEFNDTKHTRGVLSMARTSDPDSAGCQFFVCHATAEHLDNQYTAFGALEAGLDTLDKIANVQVGGPSRSTPLEPVVLQHAVVLPVLK